MKNILICTFVFLFLSISYSSEISPGRAPVFNLRIEPIRLFANSNFNIILDVNLNPNWTAGSEFGYKVYDVAEAGPRKSKINVKTTYVGARGTWFKNGVYSDGLYVSPLIRYADAQVSAPSDLVVSGKSSGALLGCFFGYGWFWQNINMMLGVGPMLGQSQQSLTVSGQDGSFQIKDHLVQSVGEYSIGWTF
jgi:hypothetical protein